MHARLLFCVLLTLIPTLASAALPFNELWREALTDTVVGYAAGVTGGKGGTLCTVSNLNDSGANSLRACAEQTGAYWIVFSVSGTIALQSPIFITSNKTVDGRGQDIHITRLGFEFGAWSRRFLSTTTNVIIENLTMHDTVSRPPPDDAGQFILIAEDASYIWVDHVTFYNPIDETIYIGSNGTTGGYVGTPPQHITISWSQCLHVGPDYFEGGLTDHCMLISDPDLPQDAATTITLHHNYYNRSWIRHPLSRYAKIHSFNNYYKQNYYPAAICTSSQFYSENDIFQWYLPNEFSAGGTNPMINGSDLCNSGDLPNATVKAVGPYLLDGATVWEQNPGSIFNPAAAYSYTPNTANETLRTNIVANAGRQNVTAPSETIPVVLRLIR
jgi:pectate lyase